MMTKFCFFAVLFLAVLGLLLVFQVRATDFSWKDDFSYTTLQQMQGAGWVLENPAGTRLESGGVVIDGTDADTVIRYRDFPSDIYDWTVETRSKWLGIGHSGPGLNVITERHAYGMVADGWYNHFAFSRDQNTVTFGSYQEQADAWVTMTMTRKGNTISLYCDGVLIYSYTEEDSASSRLIGVDRIAPWRGVMLYDYYQASGGDVAPSGQDNSGIPWSYFAIGGGVAAIAVVGLAVYFHFFAQGSGAASVAPGAGTPGQTLEVPQTNGVAQLQNRIQQLLSSKASLQSQIQETEQKIQQLTQHIEATNSQIEKQLEQANAMHTQALELLENPDTAAAGANMETQAQYLRSEAGRMKEIVQKFTSDLQSQEQLLKNLEETRKQIDEQLRQSQEQLSIAERSS